MLFFSSLFTAAAQGDLAKIRKFLDKGQSPDDADNEGNTPLILAARAGQLEAAKLLVSRGAEVDRQGRRGGTPLYHAAKEGHTAFVMFLLERRASPDRCARKGITPLLAAAARGHDAIVGALAESGAGLEATEKHGRTALTLGIEKGHIAVVERLILLGANVEHRSPNGETPLMQAVRAKDPAMVRRLLARGVDVEARSKGGQTALQMAAVCGGYESAELLASAGANVTQRTVREGWNLSTLARNNGFERLANRLAELEQDHCRMPAPANIVDAILTGDLCLVRIFLRRHPEVLNGRVHTEGWTPLLVAINKGFFAMAEFFVLQGADVNQANDRGDTPLHEAVGKGDPMVVRRLLEAGADPSARYKGVSVLEFAGRSGNAQVAALLQQHAQLQAAEN